MGHESRTKIVWETSFIQILGLPLWPKDLFKIGLSKIRVSKKCLKSKSDATLCTQKPAATPTFCKRNVSTMNHIEMLNLLTFCLTIGDQHFG